MSEKEATTLSDQAKKPSQVYEDKVRGLVTPAIENLVKPDQEEKAFKVLEFIRRECQLEMNLVGIRISWMLTAQALLVAAFVLSLSKAVEDHALFMCWISYLICGMGLMITWRTGHALKQADTTTRFWHERTRDLIEAALKQGGCAPPSAWHCILLGRWLDPNDNIHTESLKLSHVYLPKIFGGFWAISLFTSAWVTYSYNLTKVAPILGAMR